MAQKMITTGIIGIICVGSIYAASIWMVNRLDVAFYTINQNVDTKIEAMQTLLKEQMASIKAEALPTQPIDVGMLRARSQVRKALFCATDSLDWLCVKENLSAAQDFFENNSHPVLLRETTEIIAAIPDPVPQLSEVWKKISAIQNALLTMPQQAELPTEQSKLPTEWREYVVVAWEELSKLIRVRDQIPGEPSYLTLADKDRLVRTLVLSCDALQGALAYHDKNLYEEITHTMQQNIKYLADINPAAKPIAEQIATLNQGVWVSLPNFDSLINWLSEANL